MSRLGRRYRDLSSHGERFVHKTLKQAQFLTRNLDPALIRALTMKTLIMPIRLDRLDRGAQQVCAGDTKKFSTGRSRDRSRSSRPRKERWGPSLATRVLPRNEDLDRNDSSYPSGTHLFFQVAINLNHSLKRPRRPMGGKSVSEKSQAMRTSKNPFEKSSSQHTEYLVRVVKDQVQKSESERMIA